MPESSLSSRERVIRAIGRQPTDVLPAAPLILDLAAKYHGVSIGAFATDGRVMSEAQIALQAELQQDVIFVGLDNYYIAEGFGCEIDVPEDEIPHLRKPAVDNIADVYSLKVPSPRSDGRMPVMLEATRWVREELGDDIAVRTPGTGPFALASYFVGTQQFLVEVGLAEAGLPEGQPEAIHFALDLAADALIEFGKACWDAGSDLLHCGDSLASCEQKVIKAWKKYGARTLLHICGDSTKVLDLYAQTGADVVEIDHRVDLAYAKQRIGGQTCLLGNVDTVSTLLLGTTQGVRAASENCIAQAGAGSAYMLGSGCMVSRNTPIENVKALVDTAHSQPNEF